MHDRPLLVIGNRNYSSWSLRPWLLLRQHGVAFDELRIPLDTPAFARDIGAWSPSRTVPALRHGAVTVWDSLAICEYVSETFLDGGGWPRDAEARAVARSASAEMHSGFRALRSALPLNCRRRTRGTPIAADVAQDIARVFALWNDCRARFGGTGRFLFGDFSIADAMYAPVALRFLTYGIGLDPPAQAYVDALLGLDALQEWLRDARAESETLAATDGVA
jgi:glutathione S-transferase